MINIAHNEEVQLHLPNIPTVKEHEELEVRKELMHSIITIRTQLDAWDPEEIGFRDGYEMDLYQMSTEDLREENRKVLGYKTPPLNIWDHNSREAYAWSRGC